MRSLLLAPESSALLAAPPEVLHALADAVPDAADRLPLSLPGAPGGAEMLRAGAAAGRWARERRAVLLHGHGLRWTPLFAAASVAAGLPLVITLHNLVPRLSLPLGILLRAAFRRARFVIAVSQAVADSARTVVGDPGRLVVIPNGVDMARFAEKTLPAQNAARVALSLDLDAPVAVCVARLSPEKEVGTFLEAAALTLTRMPEARFLVAGDGPLRAALDHQVRILGLQKKARLLGMREDVPLLLAASDVLCLPSREEGLGIAALEAMAAGLPVVATRVGGLPEVVAEGETGLLVPARDPAALAAALESLLTNPTRARALGTAGRARAAAYFAREGMLAATDAVYRKALGQ